MVRKYYLDACIWRDYFENRSDNLRPLGEWAFRLIKKIIEEEDVFVVSDHLISEISPFYSQEDIKNLFQIVPKLLIIEVETNKRQNIEASELSKKMRIPFGDCLHYVLARDNDAVLITRDKHLLDFEKVKKPEDLI